VSQLTACAAFGRAALIFLEAYSATYRAAVLVRCRAQSRRRRVSAVLRASRLVRGIPSTAANLPPCSSAVADPDDHEEAAYVGYCAGSLRPAHRRPALWLTVVLRLRPLCGEGFRVTEDFRVLAVRRIEEAGVLHQAGMWSGAYYLSGYSIECALKACVLRSIRRFHMPDKAMVNDIHTHTTSSDS
jgi:hypothetical protein